MVIDSKGYIYLAGKIYDDYREPHTLLLCYTPNGKLDTSFNFIGYTTFDYFTDNEIHP